MPVPPEVLFHVRRWVAKADDDLDAAARLLASDSGLFAIIGFHAQQAAEKYLKALLVLGAVPFPRTHDLTGLRALLPAGQVPALADLPLELLSRFSVEERYPGDADPLTPAEVRTALATAHLVREAVRGVLPIDALPRNG
jgi:HEPN domain-containing protein